MLSKTLLLVLGVLLLLSLAQGGVQRKRKYEVQTLSEVKQCERKPKSYLCNLHCESDQDCQANNICCTTTCGNVCVNLMDDSVWEMPATAPPDIIYPESGSQPSFEGDMVLPTSPLSSFTTAADK